MNPSKLLTLVALISFFQTSAWATGTVSGTIISDTATVTYFSDGASAEVLSSPATFAVSSKINEEVAAVGSAATNVSSGQAGAVMTFSVINTGNTTQDYALSTSNLGNGTTLFAATDNFDAADCKIFVETNGVAGYQPETDTATFIDELQQDTSKVVYVACNIPAGQAGDEAVIDLVATARIGLTPEVLGGEVKQTPTVVFADTAGSDDAANDGKYSARSAYLLDPK